MDRSAVSLRRRLLVVAAVIGATIVLPASASAACASAPLSRAFLPWADPIQYKMSAGGTFESGAPAWTLSGGAKTVSGNEPWNLSGKGSRSLYLPAGSVATSRYECFETLDGVVRYVAKNRGLLTGALSVTALIKTGLGVVSLPVGVNAGLGTWAPSLPGLVGGNLTSPLALAADGTAMVAFRFKPVGLGAAWQIDDFYVDPFIQR